MTSACVRASVREALYAGMTTTTLRPAIIVRSRASLRAFHEQVAEHQRLDEIALPPCGDDALRDLERERETEHEPERAGERTRAGRLCRRTHGCDRHAEQQ